MIPRGIKLKEAVIPVIQSLDDTFRLIRLLERRSSAGNSAIPVLASLKNELNALVPENFIALYDIEKYADLVRYMKAIRIRAERAVSDPLKEQKKAEKVSPYVESLRHLLDELTPDVSEEKKKETEAFFWMIEEYKISVFAQELKTPYPVSQKKLNSKLSQIRRMA